MNFAAVAALPSRFITAVWYRAIEPQHISTALGYSHARRNPSRYYGGPSHSIAFDVIYLAENPLVAQFEVEALYGTPLTPGGVLANPARSWLMINALVQLNRVADLTDVTGAHAPLATNAQELTGDWKGYRQRSALTSVSAPTGTAPTQELGAALYTSQAFEGFLTISAKLPYHMVLGVFPERVATGNFIRYMYTDSAGQPQIHQIP